MKTDALTASLMLVSALFFLALIPVECRVVYWKNWDRMEFSLYFSLPFGPKHWQWKSYTRQWQQETERVDFLTALWGKGGEKQKGAIAKPSLNLLRRYGHFVFYARVVLTLLKRVKLKRLRWITEVGLPDSMQTALAVGVLWGVKGEVLTALQGGAYGGRPQFSLGVLPNFRRKGWRSDIRFCFEGRLVIYLCLFLKWKLGPRVQRR